MLYPQGGAILPSPFGEGMEAKTMWNKLMKKIELMLMGLEEEDEEILTFHRQRKKININYEDLQF
jgi:hypothetical protein